MLILVEFDPAQEAVNKVTAEFDHGSVSQQGNCINLLLVLDIAEFDRWLDSSRNKVNCINLLVGADVEWIMAQ